MAPCYVQVVSTSTVTADRSPTHALSDIDLMLDASFYFYKLALFDADVDPGEAPQFVESLKLSLARALVLFPVLAGRFQNNAESGRLEVLLNSRGVLFTQAKCSIRLDHWQSMRHCDVEEQLRPGENAVTRDSPLVSIQLTTFACGGFALAVGYVHNIMDGYNLVQFLRAWGEFHSSVPVSDPPYFDTSLLISSSQQEQQEEADRSSHLGAPSGDLGAPSERSSEADHATVKRVIFHMSQVVVEQLMADIDSGAFKRSAKPTSSHVAISSLLWSCITRARGIGELQEVKYTVPVSLRSRGRFSPPLPRGYFGNALMLGLASSKAGELVHKHISYAASVIQSTIDEVDEASSRKHVDYLASCRGRRTKPPIDVRRDVRNTTFAGFPLLDVDFGWGSMKHFRYCLHSMDLADGFTFIAPSAEGGRSREVTVCLREEHMERLLADPFFTAHCSQ